MKQNLLLLILILPVLSFAQELKLVRNKLSYSLTENYYVLWSNKKVKHGSYKVVDDKNRVLVKGNYNNAVKDGIWEYYNDNGTLTQKYDFSNSLLLQFSGDSLSIVKSSFELFNKPQKDDVIDVPYKIGGDFYLLSLLYSQKNIPQDIVKDKLNVVMTYILTISEKGKLEDWTAIYKGEYFDQTVHESVKNLPADAYEFNPAMVNNVPVKSKLIYTVNLNYDMIQVPRMNYIVTQKN